jgi:hypothetical protein
LFHRSFKTLKRLGIINEVFKNSAKVNMMKLNPSCGSEVEIPLGGKFVLSTYR